jgi:nucleotide-binding universal stress UspA family protein
VNPGQIVVATDFSARADRAIDRARQLSLELGLGLRVVHALDIDEAETANRTMLTRKMRECVLAGPEDGIEFAFPVGSPPRAIGRCVEAADVRLLVVGPARYNSLGDYVMGTTVDYILRHTGKPVLIVKNRASQPYRSLVAGTDFSAASAEAIVQAARMFPKAAVHIVHAWREPPSSWHQERFVEGETEKACAAQMEAFLDQLAKLEPRLSEATGQLVHGAPYDAIRKGLEPDPAALVVLGSQGASGLRQAVIGSVVSDLLRQMEADALVVNPKIAS